MAQAIFQVPSKQWNTTNLQFDHHLGGCKENQIISEVPLTALNDPGNKFAVPADSTADFTEFAYGAMPHAMSARPITTAREFCDCNIRRDAIISRDMFGAGVARVQVAYPCCIPAFMFGCQSARTRICKTFC